MSDALTIADQEFKTAMQKGSQFLLNAIKLERGDYHLRPMAKAFTRKDFIWTKHHDTHNQWQSDATMSSENSKRQSRVLAAIAEKNRIADSRRVSRDPCPLCGVRADIGCNHRKPA